MNFYTPREGGRAKHLCPLVTIIAIFLSIFLYACPPLEESSFSATVKVEGPLDLNKWLGVLQQIEDRGIPVTLDLSACTVSGDEIFRQTNEDGSPFVADPSNPYDKYNQFNPLSGFRYGKDLITSIILPDEADMICNAADIDIDDLTGVDSNKSAFRYFKNLRSITGKNIRLIGNLAFFGCTSLETVNFPKAVHILQYAFYGCTGLRQVNCEQVKDILPGAFENCTNLQRVDFPEVGTISQYAFKNCSSLTEVVFDKATQIGDEAFRNCTSLRTARFRANPVRTITPVPPLPPSSLLPPPVPNPLPTGFVLDYIFFYPNAFRGCRSLETLDVRNAWYVYFAGGALAEIGTHLDLYLYDDNGTPNAITGKRSYGHPQNDMYLGGTQDGGTLNYGTVTLRSITIRVPVVTSGTSQIEPPDPATTGIYHDIRGRYEEYFEYFLYEVYKPGTSVLVDDLPIQQFRINIQRGPAY